MFARTRRRRRRARIWSGRCPRRLGNGRLTLQAVFQTDHPGPLTARASLTADDGRRDEKTAVCDVTPRPVPQLKVWPNGPATGLVGGPVVYQVQVQNQGTGPATNVVLKAALDGGLEYETGGDERGDAGGHAGGGRVADGGAAGASEAGRRGVGEGDGRRRRRPCRAGRTAAESAATPG